MKIFIYPPNSLILADLVERSGHEPLCLQSEIGELVKGPEIDAPSSSLPITEEILNKGLKYVSVETSIGIRGRLGLMSDLVEKSEAGIIIQDPQYAFGCVGCFEAGRYLIYLIKEKNIPILEVNYPSNAEEATNMVMRIKNFLKNLTVLMKVSKTDHIH